MKVKKVDHISIAVKDLEAARQIWEPVLGAEAPSDVYVDESEKIHVARYELGDVAIELMQATADDGDVARFVEKHGEGIMLMSVKVDNARAAMDELKENDYPTIGGLRQFRGSNFAFIHPKKMNGVLVELIDDGSGDSDPEPPEDPEPETPENE